MKSEMKSMADNFRYLFHELYLFRPGSILLPFLGSGMQVLLSLATICLPKIVLDQIERGHGLYHLLAWVLAGSGVLFAVSAVNAVLHNRISCISQVFLFTVLKGKWEEKMMGVDYETFTSPEGKARAEKARHAVSSPNFGVVAYPGRVTVLLENTGGFAAFGAMACMLHPLVLAMLFFLFGVELWYDSAAEKRKSLLKEERALANRKLNYLAYHMRGIREGKDIRIYSCAGWLRGIAAKAVAEKDKVEAAAAGQDFRKMLLNALFVCLRNGCAYGYLIWRYFQGDMGIGDFVLYFSAITGLGSFLGNLVQGYSGLVEADHYVTDLRQFLESGEERETVGCVEGSRKQEGRADTLARPVSFTFDQVSFSYWERDEEGSRREIPILKNINLVIKPGEKLAIVGANGAGKTTFVKLLCGLLRPTKGTVRAGGIDCAEFEGEDYRRLFSAVFQKSGVLPVSIRDNITLDGGRQEDGKPVEVERQFAGEQRAPGAKSRPGEDRKAPGAKSRPGEDRKLPGAKRHGVNEADGIGSAAADSHVWKCLRLANLEEKVRFMPQGLDTCLVKRIAEHGTELSGGELQRLLLARALYKDAPVLILDEPTAALDPIAEHEVYQAYRQLTEGKTAVFISHRLASTRFCDRILVMEEGEVRESGTHEELMALGGRYADMFQVQSRYYADDVESLKNIDL
ncbi:MAG: ABC transporter ATP-binding protein [Lachnospiraceae bacterium]|nr:ABC transporter ATP-binding protein [Lachnospiraceae bacterium]